MATYFTKSEAKDFASTVPGRLAKSFGQILAEDSAHVSSSQSFDIFLAHSVLDAELVVGVKTMLEKRGHSVYVDWVIDNHLDRSSVSPETAALLRVRMMQSKSLLFVATSNASSSKWMPWELGYFDGLRKGGVAIFPLLDSQNETFRGQEYLGLYPVVRKDFYVGSNVGEVFVEDSPRGWTTLDLFAKGRHSFSKYAL